MLSATSAWAGTVAQTPLFLTNAAKPVAMLNISKDHQLYFKAFDDFSDLDGDGLPDTTYKNSIEYYGYFDSYKCYNYNTTSNQFEPFSITTDKYCTGNWSGNFLNWSTMTRMDVVRKILYGGLRSTDTVASTVLERSHLPNDAHSIAKFYKGADLDKLTPYTLAATSGVTLCSTTISTQYSQKINTVTDPPKIRVAKGDYSLWSAGEAWQCRWLDEKNNGSNGNSTANKAFTEMNAGEFSPALTVKLDELVARVQVCASTALVGQEQCKNYNGILKPIGLLQTYGDDGLIRFGLMTGSYAKNTTGGVLRKNVGLMTDEIDVSTGIFKAAPANGGIINTLNLLRIYGYNHNTGTYIDAVSSGGDGCPYSLLTMFADGNCTNWGNPQAEILLESLRYLAGKAASTAFNFSDASYITGLPQVSWADPISPTEWCANINVIQFNASVTSFDADKLSTATELGIPNLDAVTDNIGTSESIAGNPFFIGYLSGGTGTNINNLCTAKTISALSAARGVCPASPSLLGSYQAAGLAYAAKSASIRSDLKGSQTVTTYGVALAPYTPQVVVAVPNSSNTITILPACQNLRDGVNNSSRCGLVDFKIIYQNTPTTTATATCPTVGANCGKFYVNWETAEQGGDFDMDMLGILSYEVKADGTVKITTDVFKGSTGAAMGFGYIINGTTKDGFHAHSGYSGGTPAAGYIYVDPTGVTDCKTKCTDTDAATTATYAAGTSTASILKQPLFYAAKWGGFIDSNGNNLPDLVSEWDSNTDGIPDRYFAATNPKQLAKSLGDAFADVLRTPSSASSVATNSTQFQSDTLIYQATFNSTDWSGHLLAYKLITEDANGNGKLDTGEDSNGNGKLDAGAIGPVQWDAGNATKDLNGNGTIETGEMALIASPSNRRIYSYAPTKPDFKGIEFQWGAASTYLNDAQKAVLDSANLANTSSPILNYLRGDQSNEIKVSATGIYRTRSNLL
ncbi:MAG: hypothetical protein PHU14_04765, partial [Methylovulum sp.]|nr:hypothetical protein [Methylovulum sp.]